MAVRKHKEAVDKEVGTGPDLPLQPTPTALTVRNTHTNDIALESGIIKPGQEGIATPAELSCLLGEYVELVEEKPEHKHDHNPDDKHEAPPDV